MTEKEKIFYLRKKYNAHIIDCTKLIKEHPDIDLDSKETKLILGYMHWLNTFLDGDRRYETYLKEIGEI